MKRMYYLMLYLALCAGCSKDFTETVNGVSFKMVYVQGGTFTMGESNAFSREKPTHSVTLTKDYYIGECEVTQGVWEAVMGSNPSYFPKGDNYPVEQVSWNDIQTFLTKLNRLTGKTYALPTEAQWEYAARGGRKSAGYKYSGSNDINDVAWYTDNSSSSTHPVGQKKPNELGLYDMSGNVWEWCQDWYDSSYYSNSPSTDPTGPTSGTNRVLHGGSWFNYAFCSRVSHRDNFYPGYGYSYIGFRLVLLAGQPSEYLNLSEDTLNVSASGGTVTANMAANVGYKVEIPSGGDWISRQSSSATQLTLMVSENTGNSSRETTVTLCSLSGNTTATLKIKQSGSTFTETVGGVSFKMVYVEKGTFMMGAPEGDSEAMDLEKPAHSVTLTKDYYIGECEVTQGLWKAIMGSNPSCIKKGDDYPVENVSWEDAQEFCAQLSRKTGKTYTLPTEAQWEFAARGGVKSKGYKYSGSDNIKDVTWYGDNSGNRTHIVGTKKPNELGIYDMSGNVMEWCQDWYDDYSSSSQTDPTGPSSGFFRVLRCGNWAGNAKGCRVSTRFLYYPERSGNGNFGFRLLLLP